MPNLDKPLYPLGMQWYYNFDNQAQGPVEAAKLAELLMKGKINGDTLVWNENLPDWIPMSQTELIAALSDIPTEKPAAQQIPQPAMTTIAEADASSSLEPVQANLDPQASLASELKNRVSPDGSKPEEIELQKNLETESQLATFRSGANWFYWIAGLTVLNLVLILANSPISLALGLASTDIILFEAMYMEEEGIFSGATWIAACTNIILCGLVAGIGWLAHKKNQLIYGIGLAIIAIDSLLFIFPLFSIIAIVVHGYALFAMFSGWMALSQMRKM